MPQQWTANNGITIPEFVDLAQNEGLQSVKTAAGNLTEQQLEVLLRNNGPLWCAGYWDGVPHIVVLTGVANGQVYINDPNPAQKQRVETLAWFNQKRAKIPNAIMYSN